MADRLKSNQARDSTIKQFLGNLREDAKTNWGMCCWLYVEDLDYKDQESQPFKFQWRVVEERYTRSIKFLLAEDGTIDQELEPYNLPADMPDFQCKIRITAMTVQDSSPSTKVVERGIVVPIGIVSSPEDPEPTTTEIVMNGELVDGRFIGSEQVLIKIGNVPFSYFKDLGIINSTNPAITPDMKAAEEEKPTKAVVRVRFELLDRDNNQIMARTDDGFYTKESPLTDTRDYDAYESSLNCLTDKFFTYEPKAYEYKIAYIEQTSNGYTTQYDPYAGFNFSPPYWVVSFRNFLAIIYFAEISHELGNYDLVWYVGGSAGTWLTDGLDRLPYIGKKTCETKYVFPKPNQQYLGIAEIASGNIKIHDIVPSSRTIPLRIYSFMKPITAEQIEYIVGMSLPINGYVEVQRWMTRNGTTLLTKNTYPKQYFTENGIETLYVPIAAPDIRHWSQTGEYQYHYSTYKLITGSKSVSAKSFSVGVFQDTEDHDAKWHSQNAARIPASDYFSLLDMELNKQLRHYQECFDSFRADQYGGNGNFNIPFEGYETTETVVYE